MISWHPEEVERRFARLGIPNRFTSQEKSTLTTPIVEKPDGLIAFPTPAAADGLNLLTLRKILGTNPSKQPAFFDHPWYLEEAFAEVDCPAGWHILHSDVLPESISQPIHYASSLAGRGLTLPSAVEVTLMLFLHYVVCSELLLLKIHTLCCDTASLNRCVTVGAFGRNGLFISGHP